MNLLVIGGTVFVGRHFAEAALARGHEVTVFHRGSRGTGQIAGAQEILGDREGDLSALKDRHWDAVIDTCGYVPRVVRHSVDALRDHTDRYLFVSTISVYEEDEAGGMQEPTPKPPLDTEEVNGETYGPLKVECEAVVREAFGDRGLIVRPGIVAGPHDPTDRFTYWVRRIAEGGEVLVPAVPESALQLIDARDLGEFMVLSLERNLSGTFDAAGEASAFGEMIETVHTLNLGAELVWAQPGFLAEQGVALWRDLPLALPLDDSGALMRIDSAAAVAEGLQRRPLIGTARDTLAWSEAAGTDAKRTGLSREREAEVVARVTVTEPHRRPTA